MEHALERLADNRKNTGAVPKEVQAKATAEAPGQAAPKEAFLLTLPVPDSQQLHGER